MAETVSADIAALRLAHQRITRPAKVSVADTVRHLVAVQAQDFAGAKWGVGLRTVGTTNAEVARAFDAGEIIRTHVLRPTWHFTAPEDLRALFRLTGPRVLKQNGSMTRKLGLSERTLVRSTDAIAKALAGGHFLTRDQLREVLAAARIPADGPQHMTYLMMHAELTGAVCSGPRVGKQFSYALLDERAPARLDQRRDDEEFLVTLAGRYLGSRGPSTERDFAWWAGLTLRDARQAFEALRSGLRRIERDGMTYWMTDESVRPARKTPVAELISIYDEYISSYRSRDGVIVSPDHVPRLVGKGNALAWVLIIDGQVTGTWRRVAGRDGVRIELELFRKLAAAELKAVGEAALKYQKFLGERVQLVVTR